LLLSKHALYTRTPRFNLALGRLKAFLQLVDYTTKNSPETIYKTLGLGFLFLVVREDFYYISKLLYNIPRGTALLVVSLERVF
jgi:hypothetical protein